MEGIISGAPVKEPKLEPTGFIFIPVDEYKALLRESEKLRLIRDLYGKVTYSSDFQRYTGVILGVEDVKEN